MKSIGIDIGTSLIKVIEVQASSRGHQITNYFEHRLNLAANSDHSLETIEFLRGLMASYDPAQVKFCIGLRQDRVAIRHKFFPFSDRLKIHKSLPFELEEDIPFSPENAIFDAKIIRTRGAGADVLACAAPKTQIEKAVQFAQDCGFQASLLSDEGIAFANLIENWQDAPPHLPPQPLELEGTALTHQIDLVLNMGHTRTLVCAFEGQRLIGVRSVLWGGKNIAEALAKKYSIPYFEAMKELESKGFILVNKQGASFDQISFSDTISASVRELIRDLQLTMLELKSEFNAQITGIQITGGASQIMNLAPFMTQSLDIPVNIFEPLNHFTNALIERSPQQQARIGTALGLALEGFKKPRNPALNFLREEFASENHSWKAFTDQWGATLKFAGLAFVVLLTYSMLRESVSVSLAEKGKETLREQAKQVAGLKGKQASERGIRQHIQEKKKIAADLRKLEGLTSMNSALDILLKVSNATPSGQSIALDVKEFSVRDDQVSIQGYVNSPRELSILEQTLSSVSLSGKILNQASSLPEVQNRIAFALSFNVDRDVQKGN